MKLQATSILPLIIVLISLCGFVFGIPNNSPLQPSPEQFSIKLWSDDDIDDTPVQEKISIASKGTIDERRNLSNVHHPEMLVFLPKNKKAIKTGVLICPGGGYGFLSIDKEGIEIAKWFNSIGVTAFVLKYRLKEYGYPAPLDDAERAMRIIRSRAGEFDIHPNQVGVIGFSAGGHLASTLATHYHTSPQKTDDPLDKYSTRPDFLILLYPVISMQDGVTHMGSKKNLLGDNPDTNLVNLLSNELQVNDKTPPAFIAHANDDKAVSVLNPILFYTALVKAGVPAEMHLYEKGSHGFGMRPNRGIAANNWPVRCAEWLAQRGLVTLE